MRCKRLWLHAERLGAVVAVTLVMSCSALTTPVDPDAIVGHWALARGPMDPPGSSLAFNLQRGAADLELVGSGQFAGEAGPFGAVEVTGTIFRDSVRLTLTYKPDPMFAGGDVPQDQFVGRLTKPWNLVGVLTTSTQAHATVTFAKQVVVERL